MLLWAVESPGFGGLSVMKCRRLRANTHRMGCGWACAEKGTANNALSEESRESLTNEGRDTFLFASASVTFFIPTREIPETQKDSQSPWQKKTTNTSQSQ